MVWKIIIIIMWNNNGIIIIIMKIWKKNKMKWIIIMK